MIIPNLEWITVISYQSVVLQLNMPVPFYIPGTINIYNTKYRLIQNKKFPYHYKFISRLQDYKNNIWQILYLPPEVPSDFHDKFTVLLFERFKEELKEHNKFLKDISILEEI